MDPFSTDFKQFVQETFSPPLYQKFTPYDRNCRGASKELYMLMLMYAKQNPHLFSWITSLDIVSGMAHTFLRGTLVTQPGLYFYIDPTIAQFIPKFTEGIFVGSEQTLRKLAIANGQAHILDDYIATPERYPPAIDTQLMNQAKAQVGGKKYKKSLKKGNNRRKSVKNIRRKTKKRRYN